LRLNGVIIEVDQSSGLAVSIKRLSVPASCE